MSKVWFLSWIVLAAGGDLGGILSSPLMPIVLMVPIFYFLLIRPQQQQRRKVQEMLASLKTGDRVITSGGIYGTIVGFRDSVVQLQIANQVKIEVSRSAISGLATAEGESKGEEPARDSGRREGAVKGRKA